MADEAKRGKRWADESDDEASEDEEVKTPVKSTRLTIYLTNLSYELTEAELRTHLPLTAEEGAKVILKFNRNGDKFTGIVEVNSSDSTLIDRISTIKNTLIRNRPVGVADTLRKNSDAKRKGGKNYDRRESGKNYSENRTQEAEGPRHRDSQGGKPRNPDGARKRDNFKRDAEGQIVRPKDIEGPKKELRNENPEYKMKTAEPQAPKSDTKLPKSSPFGQAKPISTRDKDIEFDKKHGETLPVEGEPEPIVVPKPKSRGYRPKIPQTEHGAEDQKAPGRDTKPPSEHRAPAPRPQEEVKTFVRRPAWENPDHTRELFQVTHKTVTSKETPKEDPEKQEQKQEEKIESKSETKPEETPEIESQFRKTRGVYRGKRRVGRTPRQ